MWTPLTPVWSKPAAKQLRKIGGANAARIEAAVNRYAVSGLGDVTTMRTEPGSIRLKVGEFRVVFAIIPGAHEMRRKSLPRLPKARRRSRAATW